MVFGLTIHHVWHEFLWHIATQIAILAKIATYPWWCKPVARRKRRRPCAALGLPSAGKGRGPLAQKKSFHTSVRKLF